MDAYRVVKDFEERLAEYTGAKYVVTVDSCTNALFLSLKYSILEGATVAIPKYTYLSVPMQIIHAGGSVRFTDELWKKWYWLRPTTVIDSARYLAKEMYIPFSLMCLSFHWNKTLGISRGGGLY